VSSFNVFLNLLIPLFIGSYKPPWDEDWELDNKFFRQRERSHPESTFAKVIKNISSVVEMGDPFLELIPNSPFLARSLVKGLEYLLKLGNVRTVLVVIRCTHDFERRKLGVQKRKFMTLRCRCRPGSTRWRRPLEREGGRNLLLRPERILVPYGRYLLHA